mmetsp:Transcript_75025/g.168291  ORF Transcript_75025/g.168291 Transcript_75025/m.168291 type:complete len:256 (+) Transcript_75025:1-768(+)
MSGISGNAAIMEFSHRRAQAGAASASTFRRSLPCGTQLLLPSFMPLAKRQRTQFFLPKSWILSLGYFLSKISTPARFSSGVEVRTTLKSRMLPTTSPARRARFASHCSPCCDTKSNSKAAAWPTSSMLPASAAQNNNSQAADSASRERCSEARSFFASASESREKPIGSIADCGAAEAEPVVEAGFPPLSCLSHEPLRLPIPRKMRSSSMATSCGYMPQALPLLSKRHTPGFSRRIFRMLPLSECVWTICLTSTS